MSDARQVNALAALIREVDGSHSLGAGALAEKLIERGGLDLIVSRATVTAIATRSGDWWAVEVPSIPGLFTQVRDLDDVADMVKAAAADLLDVEVVFGYPHDPPAIRRVVYPAGEH